METLEESKILERILKQKIILQKLEEQQQNQCLKEEIPKKN